MGVINFIQRRELEFIVRTSVLNAQFPKDNNPLEYGQILDIHQSVYKTMCNMRSFVLDHRRHQNTSEIDKACEVVANRLMPFLLKWHGRLFSLDSVSEPGGVCNYSVKHYPGKDLSEIETEYTTDYLCLSDDVIHEVFNLGYGAVSEDEDKDLGVGVFL